MKRTLAFLVAVLSLASCGYTDRELRDMATETVVRSLCHAAQSTRSDGAVNCGRTQPGKQPI